MTRHLRFATVIFLSLLFVTSCQQTDKTAMNKAPVSPVKDIHSYGNPEAIKVTHVDLDWDVLFDKKIIKGRPILDLKGPTPVAMRH